MLVQAMVGTVTKSAGSDALRSRTMAGSTSSTANTGTVALDTAASTWTDKSIPVGTVQGWGATEAPRGALMHQCTITNGKIVAYQCIVPTTWNGSPKDAGGNNGAIEQAMIGAVFNQTPANYGRSRKHRQQPQHRRWRRRGPAYRPVLRPVHRVRGPLRKTEVSDLKRISLVLVLALALTLVFVGSAYANFGPHGGYIEDTDSCAGCHRAHTSFSAVTFRPRVVPPLWDDADNPSALLVGSAATMSEFCNACHGDSAPGASTNVIAGLFDGGPSAHAGGHQRSGSQRWRT